MVLGRDEGVGHRGRRAEGLCEGRQEDAVEGAAGAAHVAFEFLDEAREGGGEVGEVAVVEEGKGLLAAVAQGVAAV